jgi:hypothetical protein
LTRGIDVLFTAIKATDFVHWDAQRQILSITTPKRVTFNVTVEKGDDL